MPVDSKLEVGNKEKKWLRALYALPILAFLYGASETMGPVATQLIEMVKTSHRMNGLALLPGQITPVVQRYFGIASVDRFVALYVSFFTPFIGRMDPVGRIQGIAFLADLVPLQAIWMIEGSRRGNSRTVAHLLYAIFFPDLCSF